MNDEQLQNTLSYIEKKKKPLDDEECVSKLMEFIDDHKENLKDNDYVKLSNYLQRKHIEDHISGDEGFHNLRDIRVLSELWKDLSLCQIKLHFSIVANLLAILYVLYLYRPQT